MLRKIFGYLKNTRGVVTAKVIAGLIRRGTRLEPKVLPDVMIDLETLGNGYDGLFTNIGACQFDPHTGEIGALFECSIDWRSSLDAGRTITAETVQWWLAQSKDAKDGILKEGIPLDQALSEFAKWIHPDAKVWGNGSNFDIGKLEHAYGYYNIPWKFFNIRDVRTVCDLASGLVKKTDVPFEGVSHTALADAIHQATYVSKMVMAIDEAKALVIKLAKKSKEI